MTFITKCDEIPLVQKRAYPDLQTYLRESGETAEHVARVIGCVPSYISMIRWRERQPSLGVALKIAQYCNIPLESLLQKAS